MAPPVYTELLWATIPTAGVGATPGPPADGTRWIIHSIDVYNGLPWYTSLEGFEFYGNDDGCIFYGLSTPWVYPGISYHWGGQQVVNAGDELWVLANDSEWSVRVTGAVLTLP
jgi:hypothetical protein